MRAAARCLLPSLPCGCSASQKEASSLISPKLVCSSFDYGLVHTVVLNNYIEFTVNTPQYNWCASPVQHMQWTFVNGRLTCTLCVPPSAQGMSSNIFRVAGL